MSKKFKNKIVISQFTKIISNAHDTEVTQHTDSAQSNKTTGKEQYANNTHNRANADFIQDNEVTVSPKNTSHSDSKHDKELKQVIQTEKYTQHNEITQYNGLTQHDELTQYTQNDYKAQIVSNENQRFSLIIEQLHLSVKKTIYRLVFSYAERRRGENFPPRPP